MIRLLLLVVLFSSSALTANAASMSQYSAAFGRIGAAIEISMEASPQTPLSKLPLVVARKVLTPITFVTSAKGVPYPINNEQFIQRLSAAVNTHNIRQLHSLNNACRLMQQESLFPTSGRVKAERSVSLAQSILAGPAYSSVPLPPPALSDRLASWIDRQLNKIHLPHHHASNVKSPSVSPAFIQTLLYLLLAAVIGGLIYVLVQLLSRQQRNSITHVPLDAAESALVEVRDESSLILLAERHAREGDYRRAFRLVYLAALISLDTGNVLRFRRSKTNWEYLRELRMAGREDVYLALAPFTRDFDRVWYGFREAAPIDYERALAQYHALQAVDPQSMPSNTQPEKKK